MLHDVYARLNAARLVGDALCFMTQQLMCIASNSGCGRGECAHEDGIILRISGSGRCGVAEEEEGGERYVPKAKLATIASPNACRVHIQHLPC